MNNFKNGFLFFCLIFACSITQPSNRPQLSYYELPGTLLGYFIEDRCSERFDYQYRQSCLKSPVLNEYRNNVTRCANCTAVVAAITAFSITPQPFSPVAAVLAIPVARCATNACCNRINK